MEVYVDDILVKSLRVVDLYADVEETCQTLRANDIKLNPNKCLFGAKSGRFLGYIVTEWGIEVNPSKMTTPISIKDVRREVKILKALSNHNNLVKFYDACEDALSVYVVMELCEGGELLERILSRGGRYSEEDAKAIVIQILSVIAFCHLQGVVHRDLKPENFLFTTRDENAQMKLIDFGLSNFVKPGSSTTNIQTAVPGQTILHPSYSIHQNLEALSKALIEDHLFYLRSQFKLLAPNGEGHISFDNFQMTLLQNATEAMKESKLEPLSYRKMDFEEFCAAAISPHHFEALDGWEQMTSMAFEHFEREGNRAITVKELAQNILCRFDIPRRLISDNRRQFAGRRLRDWCEGYDI
ncbi:CDPK-related kinase 3-like [Zingiber officinale]|uniref:CDPK-related kinase 3-like n=1 Tax=Zingiber officinale TaxID=94328 RepID=UPI001C4ABA7C|nr:CDPK-related kinase 3-like [Zingiber officinale]